MSTATAGRAREHRVRNHLDANGYPFIMRSAGSKGAADLLHGNPLVGALLVQVGTGNKTLGPADRHRLVEAAELCHALPIVAQVIARPGKPSVIRYWLINRDTPAKWTEWRPEPEGDKP